MILTLGYENINSINISIHKALLSLLGIALYPLSCLFFPYRETFRNAFLPHPTSVPVSVIRTFAFDMMMSFFSYDFRSHYNRRSLHFGIFLYSIKDNNNFGLLKYIIKREDMRQLLTTKETILKV